MIDNKGKHSRAVILLLVTALLWSLAGVLIKQIELNPMAISAVRSAIAAIVIICYKRKLRFNWSFEQIGGAISYAIAVSTLVIATKMTTAANAILLQYTAPIYIAIFGGWFLKEKTKLLDWITVFITFGGMVLFFLDELSYNGMIGNIVGVVSGIGFAGFAMFSRKQKDGSPIESVLLGNIITALIGVPFMFESIPDFSGWSTLLVLGVVQYAIPYILFVTAIKNVTAIESLLIPIIEPILNPLWVLLVIGEVPGKWAFVGGIIVIIAVIVRCIESFKTKLFRMNGEVSLEGNH